MVYVAVAFADAKTVVEPSVVPVQVFVVVLNPTEAHTMSLTVSFVSSVSLSDDVE
jgi:hypothetical protein